MAQLRKLVRLLVSNNTELAAAGFRSLQALEELRFLVTDDPLRFAEEVNELGKCNLRYLSTSGEIAKRVFCNPCCTYTCLQVLEIQSFIGMVPRGMASLEYLVELCMSVEEFDKEGLHVLMGLPSLARLQLRVARAIKEKLTIGSDGFKLLKFFDFQYWPYNLSVWEKEPATPDHVRLTFAPGAVPALRRLRLQLNPMSVASDFFASLGVEHLSILAHLEVVINCYKVAPGMVEALERCVEKAISLHPNHKIRARRILENHMLKDEKEAVSKQMITC